MHFNNGIWVSFHTRVFFICIFLSFYQLLLAHVELDYPVGGETFVQGQTITIQWHISVPHNTLNWDLHFSADAGGTWTPIQLNIPVDQLTYEWLVPDTLTTQGRIRVFMNNSAQDYLDISGDFTIVANTSPPLLDAPAADTVIHCSAQQDGDIQSWLSNHGGAAATNFCGDLVWTHDYQEINNGCGNTGSAMVSFTATDDCGSTVTVATVTIVDATAPVIDHPSNNMIVECDGLGNQAELSSWLAGRGGAQASDACSDVIWNHDFTALNDACGGTGMASVVFTAADQCGNAITTAGEFRIEDHTAPVILISPQDTTIICGASGQAEMVQLWLNRQGGAMANDLCGNVSWTHNFPALPDSCAVAGTYLLFSLHGMIVPTAVR